MPVPPLLAQRALGALKRGLPRWQFSQVRGTGALHTALARLLSAETEAVNALDALANAQLSSGYCEAQWAQAEANPALRDVFGKLQDLRAVQRHLMLELAESHAHYRANFKQLLVEERQLDVAQRHADSCARAVQRLEARSTTRPDDLESARVSARSANMAYATCYHRVEKSKALAAKAALSAQAGAVAAISERLGAVARGQAELAELLPEIPAHLNSRVYTQGPTKSDSVVCRTVEEADATHLFAIQTPLAEATGGEATKASAIASSSADAAARQGAILVDGRVSADGGGILGRQKVTAMSEAVPTNVNQAEPAAAAAAAAAAATTTTTNAKAKAKAAAPTNLTISGSTNEIAAVDIGSPTTLRRPVPPSIAQNLTPRPARDARDLLDALGRALPIGSRCHSSCMQGVPDPGQPLSGSSSLRQRYGSGIVNGSSNGMISMVPPNYTPPPVPPPRPVTSIRDIANTSAEYVTPNPISRRRLFSLGGGDYYHGCTTGMREGGEEEIEEARWSAAAAAATGDYIATTEPHAGDGGGGGGGGLYSNDYETLLPGYTQAPLSTSDADSSASVPVVGDATTEAAAVSGISFLDPEGQEAASNRANISSRGLAQSQFSQNPTGLAADPTLLRQLDSRTEGDYTPLWTTRSGTYKRNKEASPVYHLARSEVPRHGIIRSGAGATAKSLRADVPVPAAAAAAAAAAAGRGNRFSDAAAISSSTFTSHRRGVLPDDDLTQPTTRPMVWSLTNGSAVRGDTRSVMC